MWIGRWQKENKEKETTSKTKTINKHIINHALWLQKELEEFPLEDRYSLLGRIMSFSKRQRAIRFNPLLQMDLGKEQTILEELAKENKEDKDIPRLINACQILQDKCEKLVKDILSGSRPIKDVDVFNEAICILFENIGAMHAQVPAFKKLMVEQSCYLDQLINSLQIAENNETAETSALKKRIIRYAKFLQNKFLANIPFVKRESVLPVLDAFFKRQQQASSPCFQFAFAEAEATLEKLARQSTSERRTILSLMAKCKELRGKRKSLLCRLLPEGSEFESLVTESVDVSDFSKEVAKLANDASTITRRKIPSD